MDKRAYVFVVCGDAIHLDTLKMSYGILKNKTDYPIYIVTDPERNEYKISYPDLIEIETPSRLSHHQASIWLKTSLNKILPNNTLYAYLDTDIIVYNNPDGIFDQFIPPIIFAPDHCKLDQFSSYAVNCGCQPYYEKKRKEIQAFLSSQDPFSINPSEYIINKRKQLSKSTKRIKRSSMSLLKFIIRYIFSYPIFHLNKDFYLNKKNQIWYSNDHMPVMKRTSMRRIAKACNLKWSIIEQDFIGKDRIRIFHPKCKHLVEAIQQKFNINVKSNWQHWNGGVFLFSDASHDFMTTWHQATLDIFNDPKWKVRDQGTLIATAWIYNLQKHPTLHPEWNLILDYHSTGNQVCNDGSILCRGVKYQPKLIHIYHHFGDTSWDIWNQIMKQNTQS